MAGGWNQATLAETLGVAERYAAHATACTSASASALLAAKGDHLGDELARYRAQLGRRRDERKAELCRQRNWRQQGRIEAGRRVRRNLMEPA